jgi:hypothetical protein
MIDAIPKIPDTPKDIIERVMQARRRQDPRTAMEFHKIFKPSVFTQKTTKSSSKNI